MKRLNLTPPPLTLSSPTSSLALTFAATISVLLPLSTPPLSYPSLLITRPSPLHLHILLRHSLLLVSSLSPLLQSFARALANHPLFPQLGYTASLSIYPDHILITLSRSSPVEPILCRFSGGSAEGISMQFDYAGEGERREWLLLADRALRSFWSDKVAGIAPAVGGIGVVRGAEDRRVPVEVITSVLERMRPAEKHVEEGMWRLTVKELARVGRGKKLAEMEIGNEGWEEAGGGEILSSGEEADEEAGGILFEDGEEGVDEGLLFSDDDGGKRNEETLDRELWDMMDFDDEDEDLFSPKMETCNDEILTDFDMEDVYVTKRAHGENVVYYESDEPMLL